MLAKGMAVPVKATRVLSRGFSNCCGSIVVEPHLSDSLSCLSFQFERDSTANGEID